MTVAKPLCCNFCGKAQHAVRHLVASNDLKIGICDRCVEVAVDVVDREREKSRNARLERT